MFNFYAYPTNSFYPNAFLPNAQTGNAPSGNASASNQNFLSGPLFTSQPSYGDSTLFRNFLPQQTGNIAAYDVMDPTATPADPQDPTLYSAKQGYEARMNLWNSTPKGDGTTRKPNPLGVALSPCFAVNGVNSCGKPIKVHKESNEWMSGLSCYGE